MIPLLLALACTTDPTPPVDSGGDGGGPDDTGGDSGGDSGTVEPLDIPGIDALMRNSVSSGSVTGAQVAVWYQGRVAYAGTWGDAHPDDGARWTTTPCSGSARSRST